MIGHGGYLPQYDRMSDEQKISWFLDVEPELTVDHTEKYKLELQNQQRENSNNSEEIAELKKELLQLKAFHEWKNKHTIPVA